MRYQVIHLTDVGINAAAQSQFETDDPELIAVRVLEVLTGDRVRPWDQVTIMIEDD